MDIAPEQALNSLYNATRQLNVNAETHEVLRQCYAVINNALTPKKETENGPTENI